MITVKLYGLLRIESGIRQKQLEAEAVQQVLDALCASGISAKDLKSCVILVNGNRSSKRSKLKDGDTVVLMSPVAGGQCIKSIKNRMSLREAAGDVAISS